MPLRAHVSRLLEAGALSGRAARLVGHAWGAVAAPRLARSLEVPAPVAVVAVGGATLGGSGKTPLAIAVTAAFAAEGARATLVSHAYRAAPRFARQVAIDDDVTAVGDESLLAARALAPSGASVVVAPTRRAAVAYAAPRSDLLVLDGVAQTAPRRADVALLALDADAPWGAGRCPPAGDLRAPVPALVSMCDAIVLVRDGADAPLKRHAAAVVSRGRPCFAAEITSRGVWVDGVLTPWTALSGARLGLVTALARPSRVVAFLARRGISPAVTIALADHAAAAGAVPRRAVRSAGRGDGVDLWVATPKCALAAAALTSRVAVIDHTLTLSAEALAWLRTRVGACAQTAHSAHNAHGPHTRAVGTKPPAVLGAP